MNLLKALLVDIVVTIVIVLFVVTDSEVARWAVVIYTPLMLLLKVVALLAGSFTKQFKKNLPEASPWAYHILYAINVVALLIHGSWLLAAMWLAIWLLSFLEYRRASK